MAYRYGGDPLIESLSNLGGSIRSATSDALTRRRLDLSEQTLLGQLEQERGLAELRRLRTEQEGETTILKTKADIGFQQAGEVRAERADVRAGETHKLALETGQENLTDIRTMRPLNIASRRADIGYKGALQQEAKVRADIAKLNLKMTKDQYALQQTPIPSTQVNEFLESTNPEAAKLFRGIVGPGENITGQTMAYGMGIIKHFYTDEFDRMTVAGIDARINNPDIPAEDKLPLQAQRRQIMERMGKGNPQEGDQKIEAVIADQVAVLQSIEDPVRRAGVQARLELNLKILGDMKNKGNRLPTSAADLFREKPGSYDTLIEKLRPAIAARQGYMLGGVDDFLMEWKQITRDPNYMTPNELYPHIAGRVPPATADEWADYRKKDPAIDTQEKADAHKKNLEVEGVHQALGGDLQRIKQLLGGGAAAQPRPSTLESQLDQLPSGQAPAATLRATRPQAEQAPQDPLARGPIETLQQGPLARGLSYLGRAMTGRLTEEERAGIGITPQATQEVGAAFQQAVGRAPTPAEVQQVEELVTTQGIRLEDAIRLVSQPPTPEQLPARGLSPDQRQRIREKMQQIAPNRYPNSTLGATEMQDR